jgi:hypothetical protein
MFCGTSFLQTKKTSKMNVYKIMEELFIGESIIYLAVITKCRSDQIKVEVCGAGRTYGREEKFT